MTTPNVTLRTTKLMLSVGLVTSLFIATLIVFRYFYLPKITLQEAKMPNIIVYNADGFQTNQQGRIEYRLQSDQSTHYQEDNTTVFTKPIAYFYKPNQPYWKMTANTGTTSGKENTILLQGNVIIHQQAGEKNNETTLKTESVTLFPNKKIAQNKVFLTLEQPGFLVKSVGFDGDFVSNKITLLSQASGQVEKRN
jgi:lipopolysaccharide export system protein LptC